MAAPAGVNHTLLFELRCHGNSTLGFLVDLQLRAFPEHQRGEEELMWKLIRRVTAAVRHLESLRLNTRCAAA